MKILHVCPLWFRISPDALGGIETLMAALLEQFARAGCENTVLAAGGSRVAGELVAVVERPLYEMTGDGSAWEYGLFEQAELRAAIDLAGEHDVIHSHLGWSGWVLSAIGDLAGRVLHTLHNDVTPDMAWFVGRHPDLPLSAVSEFQAKKLRLAGAEHCDVIHNGLNFGRFPLQTEGKDGLVYLGRIEHAKGTDIAVDIAEALAVPLTIAGPIIDDWLFYRKIKPRLGERVQYVGTVADDRKVELLGGASCVMMPSRWEEGCALVALEAMACGTPVVGLANGALPELIENGISGFVTADQRELPELARQATTLDPIRVRRWAEERFSIATTASRYLQLYRTMSEAARGTTAPLPS